VAASSTSSRARSRRAQIESFEIGLLTLTTDLGDLAECDVVIGAIAAEIERV